MRFLLLVFLASGCVSASQMNSQMASWIDADSNVVVQNWGAPSNTVALPDGSKALTYEGDKCVVTFGVSAANKVTAANWRGNKYKCRKEVRGFPEAH